MYFGTTSFAESPFASTGGVGQVVSVTGNRINISIGNTIISADSVVLPNGKRINVATGNVSIKIGQTVLVSGVELELATNPVTVISWNPINPGVGQIWVPIDPDA